MRRVGSRPGVRWNRLRELWRAALLFCAFFIVFGSLVAIGYPDPWGAALFNALTTFAALPFLLWISFELDRRSGSSWRSHARVWLRFMGVPWGVIGRPGCLG